MRAPPPTRDRWLTAMDKSRVTSPLQRRVVLLPGFRRMGGLLLFACGVARLPGLALGLRLRLQLLARLTALWCFARCHISSFQYLFFSHQRVSHPRMHRADLEQQLSSLGPEASPSEVRLF